MYPQIETIRKALALLPDEEKVHREEAMHALKTLYATLEVQGARIIQLNNMIPLDEVGHPATQEYLDALLQRPPLPQAPPVPCLATIVCRAVDVFGDPERAAHWLDSPIRALGGRTPREVAASDAQAVLSVLTRIEHGGHE
jgi:hypothetical protein